jgi:hypothetical protein
MTVMGGHICSLRRHLECVELETGELAERGYNHGQILGVGERILALSEDGKVTSSRLTPKLSS